MIVIVMGVSGSGKTYLATKLAEATGWAYAEGDDYHSEANKAKMAVRIPLNDEDRAPWLDSLHEILVGWNQQKQSGILTCSALKEEYRQHLTADLPEARFVWLDPPKTLLENRITHRVGHYMPPALLESQLATLERPTDTNHTLRLDGSEPIPDAIQMILKWLNA